MTDQDHLERTYAGHAFCLLHVPDEEEFERIRTMKSLEGCSTKTVAVVGGYRPYPPPSQTSTSSTKDRDDGNNNQQKVAETKVQLVTICHDYQEENDDDTSTVNCFHIPCFGGMEKTKKHLRKRKFDEHDDDEDITTKTSQQQQPLLLSNKGWKVIAKYGKFDMTPIDTTDKVYEEVIIGGWPCCVEPNWSGGDKELEKFLAEDISAARKLLPPHAREYLQKNCKIWINKSNWWGAKCMPVKGRGCCYHPDKRWLVDNGVCSDKHQCVEIHCAPHYKTDHHKLWGTGGVMVHELSHAYHHSMLPDGYDNKEIDECYKMAMKDDLYKSVEVHGTQGPKAKAYACTNRMEYWAELSTAFLGGLNKRQEYNKWYPFNRQQLKEHDPRAFALLSKLWKPDAVRKM